MSIEKNKGNNNCIPMSGIAYVIIPPNCDAAEYVERCYRNNTLSIAGGLETTAMHHVKVIHGVLDKIKFPNNRSEFGSSVFWVRESILNKPLIIGVLPEGGLTTNFLFNGQQRLYQEDVQRLSEIFLDALNSRVNIRALGDLTKSSEITIKASSGADEGDVINIESQDLLNLCAKSYRLNVLDNFSITINSNDGEEDYEGDVPDFIFSVDNQHMTISDRWGNIFFTNESGMTISDRWGNCVISKEDQVYITDAHENQIILTEDRTQVLCPKFDLGEGTEQMVLGNTLVDILGQLIDAITNLTVLTPQGASGTPINTAEFTEIKNKLDTILSKLSNTD